MVGLGRLDRAAQQRDLALRQGRLVEPLPRVGPGARFAQRVSLDRDAGEAGEQGVRAGDHDLAARCQRLGKGAGVEVVVPAGVPLEKADPHAGAPPRRSRGRTRAAMRVISPRKKIIWSVSQTAVTAASEATRALRSASSPSR